MRGRWLRIRLRAPPVEGPTRLQAPPRDARCTPQPDRVALAGINTSTSPRSSGDSPALGRQRTALEHDERHIQRRRDDVQRVEHRPCREHALHLAELRGPICSCTSAEGARGAILGLRKPCGQGKRTAFAREQRHSRPLPMRCRDREHRRSDRMPRARRATAWRCAGRASQRTAPCQPSFSGVVRCITARLNRVRRRLALGFQAARDAISLCPRSPDPESKPARCWTRQAHRRRRRCHARRLSLRRRRADQSRRRPVPVVRVRRPSVARWAVRRTSRRTWRRSDARSSICIAVRSATTRPDARWRRCCPEVGLSTITSCTSNRCTTQKTRVLARSPSNSCGSTRRRTSRSERTRRAAGLAFAGRSSPVRCAHSRGLQQGVLVALGDRARRSIRATAKTSRRRRSEVSALLPLRGRDGIQAQSPRARSRARRHARSRPSDRDALPVLERLDVRAPAAHAGRAWDAARVGGRFVRAYLDRGARGLRRRRSGRHRDGVSGDHARRRRDGDRGSGSSRTSPRASRSGSWVPQAFRVTSCSSTWTRTNYTCRRSPYARPGYASLEDLPCATSRIPVLPAERPVPRRRPRSAIPNASAASSLRGRPRRSRTGGGVGRFDDGQHWRIAHLVDSRLLDGLRQGLEDLLLELHVALQPVVLVAKQRTSSRSRDSARGRRPVVIRPIFSSDRTSSKRRSVKRRSAEACVRREP